MNIALKRTAFCVAAAGYGLGLGVAIAFALLLIASISLVALYVVVAVGLAFEVSRLLRARRRGGVDSAEPDELSDRQHRLPLPLLLFVACVAGGLFAFSIAAIQGTVDGTSVAFLIGLCIGAGIPTAVDMSLPRGGE